MRASRKPDSPPLDSTLRDRLIDTAETLFATSGIAAVSFRQICGDAQTKNNYAVQYYFGDLNGLIRAIIEKRVPQLEMKRAELLSRKLSDGPLTTRTTLELLNRPFFEHVDADGRRNFARFNLALLETEWGWEPLSQAYVSMPVTRNLVAILEELNPHLSPELVWRRLYLVSIMMLACARSPTIEDEGAIEAVLANALDMAAAAMGAEIDRDAMEALSKPGRRSVYARSA